MHPPPDDPLVPDEPLDPDEPEDPELDPPELDDPGPVSGATAPPHAARTMAANATAKGERARCMSVDEARAVPRERSAKTSAIPRVRLCRVAHDPDRRVAPRRARRRWLDQSSGGTTES